jgi:hypothetical protein
MKWGLISLAALAVAGSTAGAATSPAPVRGVTANLAVAKGDVFVSSQKLTAPVQIPIGAVVDARRGTARLTVARDSQGHVQTGTVGGGIFQVVQRRSSALTELRMGGGMFESCTRAGAGPVRRLVANVHGRFRIRGRYSSATANGTKWTMTDTCSGTLTVVARGTVDVRDAAAGTTVRVTAGHRYLARPR